MSHVEAHESNHESRAFEKAKALAGRQGHICPTPIRFVRTHGSGHAHEELSNDTWRIHVDHSNPRVLELKNLDRGHVVHLDIDDVAEFRHSHEGRHEGHLLLRCLLKLHTVDDGHNHRGDVGTRVDVVPVPVRWS